MESLKSYIVEEIISSILCWYIGRAYSICTIAVDDIFEVVKIDFGNSTCLGEVFSCPSRKKLVKKLFRYRKKLVHYKRMIISLRTKYREPLRYYLSTINDVMDKITQYVIYMDMMLEREEEL